MFLGTLGPSSRFSCNALLIIYVKSSSKLNIMINKLIYPSSTDCAVAAPLLSSWWKSHMAISILIQWVLSLCVCGARVGTGI